MTKPLLRRGSAWLPTFVVLFVVLLAGSRLVTLSVRAHAQQLRTTAELTVKRSGQRLATELPRLQGALAASKVLKGLAEAGYDFEVSEIDRARRFRQVLLRSQTAVLTTPAIWEFRAPAGFLQDSPDASVELAIAPRNGWYPVRELATSFGLLAVVAWLLAFGAHDMTHSLQRSKAALAALKDKVKVLNHKLTAEIDSRQQLQQSFDHARYHDAFTGLPNRRFFMDRLDRALRDVRTRRRQRVAIVLIEIDRFRLINDTLGQTAGDELMLQVALRLGHAASSLECVLARWRDDQFAALMFDPLSSEAAFVMANQLQDSLHEPFELRKHRLTIAARMGLTTVESGLQRTEDALREADIALSFAKRPDSSRTLAYQSTMGGDIANLVSLEADLHLAIAKNELRLLFQPIIDLQRLRVAGVEALLRWEHPVEGLLPPDRFLPIAEEAGLIVPLTRWVITRVCRVAQEWRRRLPEGADFFITVNLSAAMLKDTGLGEFVSETLRETHTLPRMLKFELTEGGLINNVGAAREMLDGLHRLGIELMLDDFGTGYSSLSYLQLFPFDYLKLDRPFVNRTGNKGITSAVLQMASSLGLRAVAEIVETQASADSLTQMGCEFAQGFYFSEPLVAEEALHRLRTNLMHANNDTMIVEPLSDDTLVLTEASVQKGFRNLG
jgi:diguanylate cyclase (GGDEF)-like protein